MRFTTNFFWAFDIREWFCDFPTQGSVQFLNKFCFESSSCHLWPWPWTAPWVSKHHVHTCEVERRVGHIACWVGPWDAAGVNGWPPVSHSLRSLSLALTCPKLRPAQRNACWGWHILWPQQVAGWTGLLQEPAPTEQVELLGGRAGSR